MIEASVFDHTAIIALFQGNKEAFKLWRRADQDELTLVLPAVAVAEANNVIGGNSNTWRAILDPGRVVVTPLDHSTAIDTGPRAGALVVRHVVYEARETGGAIVTRAPWQYPVDTVRLWPI